MSGGRDHKGIPGNMVVVHGQLTSRAELVNGVPVGCNIKSDIGRTLSIR